MCCRLNALFIYLNPESKYANVKSNNQFGFTQKLKVSRGTHQKRDTHTNMANIGHFIDRNADMRAAGLSSIRNTGADTERVQDCFVFGHPEEKAEAMIRDECRRLLVKPTGPRTPIIPCITVGDLLSTELKKSRFMAFKEKFSEDMYFRKPKLGEITPAHSKPDSVTNESRIFGRSSSIPEPLYDIIMPPKRAEQVNREFGDFHQQRIISHNHYFPSEKINRKYEKPFDPLSTFGQQTAFDGIGLMVKRCLKQDDGDDHHVVIVRKPQMNFIDRTYGPLGLKYKKYPYDVPDMMHGLRRETAKCDVKMLLENTTPHTSNEKLVNAFTHLNILRQSLHKRPNFHMFDLISLLEKTDKERTGYLPLALIIDIMHKLHIRVDAQKMRTAVGHFRMLIDEGCATERISYEEFCRLISIQVPLPATGNISTMPENNYNKDTTYRLLCADLKKTPNKGRVERKHKLTPEQQDAENTHVQELIYPDLAILSGLGPSDFKRLRPKDQLETIFKDIVSKDEFERIWLQLMADHADQQELFSVVQFKALVGKTILREEEPT
ncbi:uncharacterized protein LOC111080702 [Drosophila obscura]|uniref:uncharacterized protein LOC111080702 n=1 Tax=Drosophila obscura TaxID=7282 RepID=UPI001BB213E5|nr:uncharacterized protein LOC111080702 [Drosophila obscura]